MMYDLKEFSDRELVDELRLRLARRKEIDEKLFLFDERNMVLCERITDNLHSSASQGQFWVLNGCYSLVRMGDVYHDPIAKHSIAYRFKTHTGKFIKEKFPQVSEYIINYNDYHDPDSVLLDQV